MKHHIKQTGDYRWEGVELLNYKEEGGTHFKSITRQVLSECGTGRGSGWSNPISVLSQALSECPQELPVELRYFEVASGGYSTLERHEHVHMVVIARGSGQCLVDATVHDLGFMDVVHIPPMTWHQFRATGPEPLGFLCLVNCDRDRPQRPTENDLKILLSDTVIANFIRI